MSKMLQLVLVLLLALAPYSAAASDQDHRTPSPEDRLGGVLWVEVEAGGEPIDAAVTIVDEDGRTAATGSTSGSSHSNPTDFVLEVGTYRVVVESEARGRLQRREVQVHVAAGDSSLVTVRMAARRSGC